MNFLLIDNSNSRTKFALGNPCGLHSWRGTLATSALNERSIDGLIGGLAWDGVMIASVVPACRPLFENVFRSRGPLAFLTARSPLGIAIDYPTPDQIGADRLANAVAVAASDGGPAIVIDFGTAVTFDVVSTEPAYCGGVIAPGLGAMAGYLSERTALLPVMDLAEPVSAIGKSTMEAMRVGAVFGYRGLVREILLRLRAELAGEPHIIATGGDATLIAAGLPEIQRVDPDLTIEGIRRVAAREFG